MSQTYQPKKRKRARTHGFLVRSRTKTGKQVLLRRRQKGRKKLIESLKENPHTVVFYEAPHRIIRALEEMFAILGDRKIAVCRELTKIFEEIFRGSLTEAIAYFKSKKPRGEFTIVLGAIIDQ